MKHIVSIALFAALGLAACGGGQKNVQHAPDPLAKAPAKLLLARGRAFASAGDTIRAEQYLVAASRRGAPDRKVVPLLMEVCIRGQRFRTALAHAERFLARNPDDLRLQQLTGSLYLATGSPERARDTLENLVESEPDVAEPRYLLAMAHQQLDDTDEAVRELRAYLELQPRGRLAREARAWLEAAGEDVSPRGKRHRRRGR